MQYLFKLFGFVMHFFSFLSSFSAGVVTQSYFFLFFFKFQTEAVCMHLAQKHRHLIKEGDEILVPSFFSSVISSRLASNLIHSQFFQMFWVVESIRGSNHIDLSTRVTTDFSGARKNKHVRSL